jgi:hypothetical protein
MHTQTLFSKDAQAFDYNDFLVEMYRATKEASPDDKPLLEKNLLSSLTKLDLARLEKWERILVMDGAIKLGQVEIVKALAGKFIVQGYADDIRIPSEDNMEHPYRPSFWLAAVATRHAPDANYEEIEEHLCRIFNTPERVQINGAMYTRNQYVRMVSDWKVLENERLKSECGRQGDRYPKQEDTRSFKK